MIRTVQELIDALTQIEDKSQFVYLCDGDCDYNYPRGIEKIIHENDDDRPMK